MRLATVRWTAFIKACVRSALLSIAFFTSSHAADLSYEITGIGEPLLSNVRSHLNAFSIDRSIEAEQDDFEAVVESAIRNARLALRPYGYYQPDVTGNVRLRSKGRAVVSLAINVGPAIIVDSATVTTVGEGKDRRAFRSWRDSWPLTKGQRLDQTVWEERKQFALDEAEASGFLGAKFTEHKLEIDLVNNRADLTLTLDTGSRYVIGNIDYGEHILRPGIVEYIPRFQSGDPYSRVLIDKFRIDLWKTSYFTEVDVAEKLRPDTEPPTVDLKVSLETSTRNTYQGSIGVGTDTGARLQAQWSRHPISSNGDRIDLRLGWQEQDDEYTLRGSYRLPRRHRARQFWIAEGVVRHENFDLDVRRTPDDDFIRIANGSVDERHLRLGRLKVRNFKSGEQQAFETTFIQFLNASDAFTPVPGVPDLLALANDPRSDRLLKGTDKVLSIGFDYDRVSVTGKGWETEGHRDRGWIFNSSESLGSDRDFTQAYLATRRSYLKGDRWKFLLRAELGYTKAKVANFLLDVGGEPLPLSVTALPNYYRFSAGGSNSVRGYGFEDLSNNHIGSNNLATFSAEVEMKFLEKWSAALFYDVGNAFNDWSDPNLKRGVGVGLRWYSIAGPIRLDIAQALDLNDRPWRVHFTIGTPLL